MTTAKDLSGTWSVAACQTDEEPVSDVKCRDGCGLQQLHASGRHSRCATRGGLLALHVYTVVCAFV